MFRLLDVSDSRATPDRSTTASAIRALRFLSRIPMAAFDTIYPADTVEFCPHINALDIFACGTYKLEDSSSQPLSETENTQRSPQQRLGQCLLFKVDPASEQGL